MKIYKGPASKDFSSPEHEKVDEKDWSKDTNSWSERKYIQVNINKEKGQRQSLATIEINPADVVALHQGLMSGLLEKAKKFDELSKLLGRLNHIQAMANECLYNLDTSEEKPNLMVQSKLKNIISEVEKLDKSIIAILTNRDKDK